MYVRLQNLLSTTPPKRLDGFSSKLQGIFFLMSSCASYKFFLASRLPSLAHTTFSLVFTAVSYLTPLNLVQGPSKFSIEDLIDIINYMYYSLLFYIILSYSFYLIYSYHIISHSVFGRIRKFFLV